MVHKLFGLLFRCLHKYNLVAIAFCEWFNAGARRNFQPLVILSKLTYFNF